MNKKEYKSPQCDIYDIETEKVILAGSGGSETDINPGDGGKDESGSDGQSKYHKYNIWED